jgi:hypothetical protein
MHLGVVAIRHDDHGAPGEVGTAMESPGGARLRATRWL